jgi:hypothetical protein
MEGNTDDALTRWNIHTKFQPEELKDKISLGRISKDDIKIYLKQTGRDNAGWIHMARGQGRVTSFREHGNEIPRFIKGQKLYGHLSNYQLLKKARVPRSI